jgi:hypothetical protein
MMDVRFRVMLWCVPAVFWALSLACGPAVNTGKKVSDTTFDERQALSDWIYDQKKVQLEVQCRSSAFERLSGMKDPQDDSKRAQLCYKYIQQCRLDHDISKLKTAISPTLYDFCKVNVSELMACVIAYNRKQAGNDYYKEFRCEKLPSSAQVRSVLGKKIDGLTSLLPDECAGYVTKCSVALR